MHVIRHENGRQQRPLSELRRCGFESFKCTLIRKDRFAFLHANRDEINHRLFPSQPNWNARWMSHQRMWQAERLLYNAFYGTAQSAFNSSSQISVQRADLSRLRPAKRDRDNDQNCSNSSTDDGKHWPEQRRGQS